MSIVAINIHNTSREMIVLNVSHHETGDPAHIERQLRGKVVQDTHGQKRVKPERARLSKSITLRPRHKPGSSLLGLPASMLHCADLQARMGDLKIECLTQAQLDAQNAKLAPKEPEEKPAPTPLVEEFVEKVVFDGEEATKPAKRGNKR